MTEAWPLTKIGECCDILDNLRVPLNAEEREDIQGEIPYYGANGLQGYIDKYIFNEALILLAEDGGYFDEYESRPIAYRISGKSWVNNHAHILRANAGSSFSQDFIFYCLEHKNITPFIKGGTRAKLNQSELREILIPKPREDVQRRIAEILSTLDETIEQTNALIAKYQQIKAGLMHDLFTRGVTPDGKLRPIRAESPQFYKESPLGWIPKEWNTLRLDTSEINIIDGDRGENYPQGHELLNSGYCLFLSATNVTRRGFKFDQLQFISGEKDQLLGTGKLIRGDIVVTTRGTVGNIAFFDDDVPFSEIRINSGMVILRCNQAGLTSDFLYCSLANYVFSKEYKRVVSGSAQPQLPIKDLKRFHCLIPPMPEQRLMLSMTQVVDAYLFAEEERSFKLRQQKHGLMHDLLTGRVRVKVAESEAA